jgi:hypothetical protein
LSHHFETGQDVRLARNLAYRTSAPGLYKIVRPLPGNGGSEPQYRIKSVNEPHDRVVNESDLERVS